MKLIGGSPIGNITRDEFYKLYQPRQVITSFSKIFE